MYVFLGQRERALGLLHKGVELLEDKEVAPRDQARLLLSYGKLMADDTLAVGGSFAEAFSHLLSARRLAEALQDQVLVAKVLNVLGETHFYQAHYLTTVEDDYTTAQEYFCRALKLYEITGDKQGTCVSLFNLGRFYQNRGEHEQATSLLQRALELAQFKQSGQLHAKLLAHLGMLALVGGDQEMARNRVVDALALRQRIGARCDLAYSHLTLAEVCHTQGDLVTALKHYQQSYALAEEMHQQNVICAVLMGIGYLHLDNKRCEQAREFFEKAYALADAIGLIGVKHEATEGLEQLAQM